MNIVTSICTEEVSNTVNPQLTFLNQKEQHEVYWMCVLVFFATSIRCNPKSNHILYTNNISPVFIDDINVFDVLKNWKVKIEHLPFQRFRPSNKLSTNFFKAFYKLDVIYDMAKLKGESIILDSDCLWIKSKDKLESVIKEELLLFDVYPRTEMDDKGVQNISIAEVGQFFKSLNPDYTNEFPTHFGGEIVAGNQIHFQTLAQALEDSFKYLMEKFENKVRLPNGRKLFDGMEYFSTYAYNNCGIAWRDASPWIRRIWTHNKRGPYPEDVFDLTIWHLPSEKASGFTLLFQEAVNPKSKFWKIGIDTFYKYLGGYVGIPNRQHHSIERGFFRTLLPKVKSKYIIYKNRF
jgi:hypothetical protein